jgi:hypothetical protein
MPWAGHKSFREGRVCRYFVRMVPAVDDIYWA